MLKKTMVRIDPDMCRRLKSIAALQEMTISQKLNALILKEIIKVKED